MRLIGLQLLATLVFLATTAYTIYCTRSMAGGMDMPGGWNMSMMWMTMPGQSLAGAALMFTAMWAAMMIAMMLPSTMPMLLLYRRVTAARPGNSILGAMLLFAGYFGVWTALGIFAWALGTLIAKFEMSSEPFSRAVPALAGASLILCGIYQWTPWKCSCLRHCRDPLHLMAQHINSGKWGAFKLGLHHGTFCSLCCWSLMLIQIVLGMMNLIAMAAIAVVIALEKLIPRGLAVAKIVGALSIAAGLYMLLARRFPM